MIRATILFHDDVAPAVQSWHGTPREALKAQEWADAVTALYPGSVLIERKCPTHDAWERLRVCPDCGVFLCTLEACDCEPAEIPMVACISCRDAGCEGCVGYRDAKGWHDPKPARDPRDDHDREYED